MRDRGRVVGEVAHEDTELVAAETRHEIVVAERVGQPRSDRRQQLVAEVVPERVVDLLEVIEVHEHHREAPALGVGVLDRLAELQTEQEPVGETGEVSRATPDTRSRAASRRAPRKRSSGSACDAASAMRTRAER